MTQQIINIGSAPNDDTGDQARIAFDKCNDNFTELYESGAGSTTEGVWNFNQTSTDTTTSPSSGRFRTNSGNAASATQFAIHRLSINGFDRADTLRTQHVGDIIKLQDKTNADSWARFTVQATPVDNVDWFQISVVFDSGGGTAPGNNQEILFTFVASGGGGGGGNVSNVGTPTNGQIAQWTDATHIQGVASSSLGFAPLASPTFTGDPKAPTPTAGDNDTSIATTAFVTAAVAAASGGSPPQGRLTLQTGTPVMTTTQSAKTTIFYAPYIGNQVPIYNGTLFTMTAFTELSVATTDTTKSPAAIGASKVNDWFVWNDAGTVRVGHGPDWTNDTTRSAGTALIRVNGIWLNNAAITNGPAAQRGTYVGTTYSNASSQLDWIYGALGAPPTAGFFGVWNCYNRVNVASFLGETTTTWTYALTAVREIRGDTTAIFTYVSGLAEDIFTGVTFCTVAAGSAGVAVTGVGYDATNAFSGIYSSVTNNSIIGTASGRFSTTSLGKHFMADCEAINAANSQTFHGSSALSQQSGMYFEGIF